MFGTRIKTPGGVGTFFSFDDKTDMVTVEMDYSYLVEYPAEKCENYKKTGGLKNMARAKIEPAVKTPEEQLVELIPKYAMNKNEMDFV